MCIVRSFFSSSTFQSCRRRYRQDQFPLKIPLIFFFKSPSLRLKQFLVHSNLPSTKTPLSISVLLDIPESYLTCFNFNLPPSRHRNRNEQTWYFDLRNPASNKTIEGTENPQILSEFANAARYNEFGCKLTLWRRFRSSPLSRL